MWAYVMAQAGGGGGGQPALGEILLPLGLMIAVLVVLGVVLMALRRRLLAPVRVPEAGMFEQLRRMREEGSITPQEYDAIRQKIVSRVAGETMRSERSAGGSEAPERTDSEAVTARAEADSSRPRQPPID